MYNLYFGIRFPNNLHIHDPFRYSTIFLLTYQQNHKKESSTHKINKK